MWGKRAIEQYIGRAAQGAVLVSATALAGCNTWYDRHGISPVISAEAVVVSTANRQAYIDAFIARARLPAPPPINDPSWYLVMDAGFSYVNEVCDAYIHELFILNRDRDRLKSGLVIVDKAANAIMFATGTSQTVMTVVAQAFGVASGATDVFANSYLYRIEPSNLQKLIKEAQSAYRATAYAKARDFTYPTAVEQGIQGYLSLCLPASIEARVNDVLNRTRLVGDTSQPTGPVIDLIATTDFVRSRDQVRVEQGLVLGNARDQLLQGSGSNVQKRKPIEVTDPDRLNTVERRLPKKFFRDLQATLCLPQDGDPGPRGSRTRQAIFDFLAARNLTKSEEITTRNRAVFEEAIEDVRDCRARGFRNVFEVATFGSANVGIQRVRFLQERLGVPQTGVLDAATRAAIARVRDPNTPNPRNGDELDVETRLLIQSLPRPVPQGGATQPPGTTNTPPVGPAGGPAPSGPPPLVPNPQSLPPSNGSKKGG